MFMNKFIFSKNENGELNPCEIRQMIENDKITGDNFDSENCFLSLTHLYNIYTLNK